MPAKKAEVHRTMRYKINEGWMTVTGKAATAKPYIARIAGLDDKYGFNRQFVGVRLTDDSSAENPVYRARFALEKTDILEFGGWESKDGGGGARVYVRVLGDKISVIKTEDVREFFGAPADDEEDVGYDMPF